MKILIRGGRLLDPSAGTDQVGDLFLEEGKIAPLSNYRKALQEKEPVKVMEAEGLWVLPGLIDLHVHLRDPGFTYKETVSTGCRAAASGGFTTIFAMPNTKPVTDNAEVVRYVKEENRKAPYTRVYPIGAITRGQLGKELADFEGMKQEGIVSISEDGKSVADEGLMRKAMVKARELGLVMFDHCEDPVLAMQGDSRAAENKMTERDIHLAEETGVRLHICHVSTKESVELLRKARQASLPVTGEATPHHLSLDDTYLAGGDPDFKMNPPLRSREDVEAVREALKDGTLTCIATDHAPHAPSEKQPPYQKAANGIVGMETAVAVVLTTLYPSVLSPLEIAAVMSTNPARTARIPGGTLGIGAAADITLINPSQQWTVDVNRFETKGRNCPWKNRRLTGSVKATILNGNVVFEEA